ncbi:hypothetical protein LA080_004256 [Diaporthe eres]|nr:hypothetical protein LA080_004256 [Diaporthe eres]
MKPNLKLDDVDVMVTQSALVQLLAIASWTSRHITGARGPEGFAFDLSLINNTLVIQKRTPPTNRPLPTPWDWNYYEAATVPVPGVEYSSTHYQLLRYNIGPFSCLVQTMAHGTVQELPTTKGPSKPQKTRNLNGIEVISAGQGVLTSAAFLASARPQETDPRTRRKKIAAHLRKRTPYLWASGQTKLGIVEIIPPGQDADPGGLTVVEMGDLVENFEKEKQDDLRRLAGLLEWIRHAVRAHGAPCVAVFNLGPSDEPANYRLRIHSAGPQEVPVLLDWHREHFWSKKDVHQEQVGPRERASNEDTPPQKGVIRQLARWLGL